MFSIYLLDSSKLFQWDLNRKIKIIGKEEVDEVHFSHIGDEEALVVKPIKENNILIANIPNILLQESKDIFVYLVSKDKTLKETFFTVGRREKPTDYLYTEIDILNYSNLEKRLAELEEKLKNISVEETDPTVPQWAKEPTKPKYTADEVGAPTKEEFSNVVLITEQSLTDEQKTQIRKNLSYYDWKTFSDTYGTYTYAIESDSVNYEIAQTIKNTSNNGDISALEDIVSFCYLTANFFTIEAPNTSLLNSIISNYNVLVDGGAINHNFFKIVYGDEKNGVKSTLYFTPTTKGDSTHFMQISQELITSEIYYNINEDTVKKWYCKYRGTSENLTYPGYAADAKTVGDKFSELKDYIDKLSFNEKAEVPSTQQDKGKVVTVNSEGDKILEYPSAISYKYAYKMQETKSAVLFCVNVGETEPCTYFIPGEAKITTLRIYKNGEAVEGSQLATQTPYDKFRVVECNETRVYLILSKSNSLTDSYFYYFSKGKWEIKVEQYPLTVLENMFIGFDNEKEFTPESDYQPTTKKYVDDECRKLSWEIADLKENKPNGGGSGVTVAQANSLWAIMQKTAFTEQLTNAELNAFKTAWGITGGGTVTPDEPENPESTLTSISATYTGGDVTVGTSINSLTGITVKGYYSDGSIVSVKGYTLSGTITEGNNTITVSYDGKTATFIVVGVAESSGGDDGGEVTLLKNIAFDGTSYLDTEVIPESVNYRYVLGIQAPNKESTPSNGLNIGGISMRNSTNNANSSYWDLYWFIIVKSNNYNKDIPKAEFYTSLMSLSDFLTTGQDNGNGLSSQPFNAPLYYDFTNGSQKAWLNEDLTEYPILGNFGYISNTKDYTDQTFYTDDEHPIDSIWLGKVHVTGIMNSLATETNTYAGVKFYCFKVYDADNNLIADMHPAKQGDTIGMYCNVRQRFFEGNGILTYEELEVA